MAEVTAGLFSLSSKKPPNFSSNGKHIYDDVFASRPPNKLKSSELCSFGDDDYAEIFGSSKADNGVWESSCLSIPILTIPDSQQRSRGSRGENGGGIDYLGVFGGVRDESFGLPDGEMLFDQLKKKARTSESTSKPRSKGQTTEAIRSHVSRQSENDLMPTKRFSQSFDGMKHFEHEIEIPTIDPSEAAHVSHANAIPGSSFPSCEVGPSQKTQTSRTPKIKEDKVLGMDINLAKGEKHSRSTSLELGVNEQKRENDSGIQKASRLSESNSVATSHESHQVSGPSKLLKEVAKVQFEVKDDAMVASPGSTSLHEVGPSQKTQIHGTPITQEDAQFGTAVDLVKKKGEHSRNTSLELGAKESKDEQDACFQKASSLNDSNSISASHDNSHAKKECDAKYDDPVDVGPTDFIANKQSGESQDGPSHDTCQGTSVAGYTNVVKNDAEISPGFDFDVGKKQARHSRMTSLDLGGHNNKQDAGFQRKSRFGSSYSFDASHDPFAARIKVQPSKVVPSSSLPQFFPVENHCKISENARCKYPESSPSSLEDQLDVNSLAAISAATLQRAIEEAEMRIRSAKEFLEREGQGNTKLTFKDTLKLKVGKENNNVNGINAYRQMNGHEHRLRVDSRMRTCSDRARKRVLETSQVALVFEGQKNSPKDDEPIRGEISESKSVEEGEKREGGGGEWEPAKHLNQLISGVKNRLASFMTWQAETEKKEEPKETEASRKSQQSQGEWEVEDAEISEMNETEKNQRASVFDYVKDSGENRTGSISEVTEPEKNELMQNNTVVQEKADDKVDVFPDNEGPTRTNYLFFTFSSERSRDHTRPEVGEKKKTQNVGEFGVENTQKEEIDEVNYDQIHSMSEKDILDGSDGICMNQDYGKSLQDSSDGESDGIVEEPYSMAAFDKSELTCNDDRSGLSHEVNPDSRLNEECGDERSEVSHQDNESLSEGCGDDGSEFTHEDDGKMNEECGNDRSEFTHQENERLSEECADNTSEFSHEDDQESRRLSKECGDEQHNFNHEEKNDTMLNEECEDHPMNSCACPETIIMTIETDDETGEYDVVEEVEDRLDNREQLEEADLVREIEKSTEEMGVIYEWQENERDQDPTNDSEEDAQQMNEWEENQRNQSQAIHTEGTANQETEQVGSTVTDDECEQTEKRFFSEPEEAGVMDGSNSGVEENIFLDEKSERMMEVTSSSSDSEMDNEITVSADEESDNMPMKNNSSSEPKEDVEYAQESGESTTENTVEFDGIVHLDGTDRVLPCENFTLRKSETDFNGGQKDVDCKGMESKSEGISEIETERLNEYEETVDVGDGASVSDHVQEKCISEAGHRRRRWFENGEKVAIADLPSTLEGDGTNMDINHDVLEESELAGSVEIHADKFKSETSETTTATESASALDQESRRVNTEGTHKRRRWFVHSGGEGIPEPPSLFKGSVERISEIDPEIVNEEKRKQNVEATPRRKRWFESVEKVGQNQQQKSDEDARTSEDVNEEHKDRGFTENSEEGKDDIHNKTEPVNEIHRRKKEKEKERIAVERAIREARERAFAEARERARRDAVERPKVEGSQRVGSGVQERPGKAPAEASSTADKASIEAKLRAERAAVERATAEARERALQKSLSEKGSHRSREPTGRHQPERNSSFDPKHHSSSSEMRDPSPSNKEKSDGADSESAQRRKARLERQNRTTERAAKALEEKNKRDLLAQKEQAARNMLADALHTEVKRWSSGKEGNLRALLSTLQYILGSDSGWQAISLTDLMAPTAVRKAYKKATLCVHPDKLQQRGATIQQKYICEKVFDLLKEAWSKFNPDER